MCAWELKFGDRFYCEGRLFQYRNLKASNWHKGWDVVATCLQSEELYVMGDLNDITLFEELYCDGLGI